MANFSHFKTLAGAPRTVRGRSSHISVHPNGSTFLYCNGNSVFIRDVNDPTVCDVYTQHDKDTTAAVYSPSANYICSGDISGKVRIWDADNKEHLLKYEYQGLGGAIKDIAWSHDSKSIAVCGEGRQGYARVINWDTGVSCGSLDGAAKLCTNVSFKQNRPHRIILASEDMTSQFFEGVPFKLNKAIKDQHTNFVNCARFSPDGDRFATAGADGKCFIHDGVTGDLIGQLCEPAGKIHNGSVYGIAWSPDSKFLMTASDDKTVKIWALDENFHESNKEPTCLDIGNELGDMQVGCAWTGTVRTAQVLISISLNGNINYLDANVSAPTRIVKGHTKDIVASCISADKASLFTASIDGLVYVWDLRSGVAELVQGLSHLNEIQNMCLMGDDIITCGKDDTVRYISVKDKKFIEDKILVMDTRPLRIASSKDDNIAVVACSGQIVVLKDNKVAQAMKVDYEPTCVAMSVALNKVAIGTDACKVVIYDIHGRRPLVESGHVTTNGNVTDVQFSPDSAMLAMCTAEKQVKVVETADFHTEKVNQSSHEAKVNSLAWTPNSRHVTSCGINGAVYTFDVESGKTVVTIRAAHDRLINVTSVQWSDENTLLTTGRQDCSIRMWKVHL